MNTLSLKIEERFAILEFDQPDSEVNVLNQESMQEFSRVIDDLATKPEVVALIITSKKPRIFIAGADIKEIEHIHSVEDARKKVDAGKEIFKRLHDLDLITVAAINGACLGGGLELSLACKYRVASFSDKVKIGLPEVMLGLLPGWGGTQRLPKLIGLTRGLTMILSGKIISGKDALKYGLVDRLFPDVTLVNDTIEFVRGLLDRRAHVKRARKKKLSQKFLEDTPIGRGIVFKQARKNVLKRTKGFYPAPLKILDVIRSTYGRDAKVGSLIESKAFSELAITEVSKSLIKVFYLNEEFKKFPWVSAEVKPAPVNKCGIVGAGVMGGGIAQLLSYRDIPTRVKDINYEALEKALKTAKDLFTYSLKKRKLKKHQVDYKLGLISPTLSYKGFENADLVIEAVIEKLEIKKKVFEELSNVSSSSTIFVSNTSSLPVIEMAEGTNAADRIAGLHFFNPVNRMPLVEVIKSTKTSDKTLATVIAFARKIGKVVIVVKDVPGFLINRILLSYLNESGYLIDEGMKIEQIDRLAREFGMPMGPVELIDEVGIDVGYKVVKILEGAYGARMKIAPILEKVKEKGLLGKKAKLGFYVHKGKNKKQVNPEINKLINPETRRDITDEGALKRMIYVMINESARCLEEEVVKRPETVDIGMIMGTGFPPFRAGLLRYADSVGIEGIVRDLTGFEKEFNSERFKPCKYLISLAEKKQKFYKEVSS
ncbi:MAG: 3-hydroxyacyl-CoA dehydrogenase NAD-binding domain-containing protein [Candidatus Omnitrophota bacterium]|jgi:3-hydroxyacyl-CoA dehydrogenase/enoyl-CoA hydratase/3-hydroxybutyryl-CoA epimerase|nr:3-hydroxyacyl-CoA dehydrogenase NAD-binding domain-containing protein [Candidatus Omnitrophota bacterium]